MRPILLKRGRHVLLIVVLQVLLSFALLEAALRILRPYHDGLRSLLYISSVETHYEELETLEEMFETTTLGFSPYTQFGGFVLNSKSFRTREYEMAKPSGAYRVLAIGDSFTFASGGTPHSDHWTTLIERDLAREMPGRVELLNLGVPGVGPQFELRLFQIEGAKLAPDLVILGFFVGNDFTDDRDAVSVQSLREGNLGEWLTGASLSVRAVRNLLRLPRAVGTSRPETHHATSPTPAGANRGGYEIEAYRQSYDSTRPSFEEEAYLALEGRRMSICLKASGERFHELFQETAVTLDAFRREVESLGSRFVVLIIPDEYQVDPNLARRVQERSGHSASEYDLDLPQRRLAEFFQDRNIEYIDVLEAFRQQAEHQPLYKLRDSHWNRAGNRLAAQLVSQRLSSSAGNNKQKGNSVRLEGADARLSAPE